MGSRLIVSFETVGIEKKAGIRFCAEKLSAKGFRSKHGSPRTNLIEYSWPRTEIPNPQQCLNENNL